MEWSNVDTSVARKRQARASSSFSDLLVLVLLYVQLILGLSTIFASSHHMDGSVMVMLANWAQSLAILQPMEAAASIAPVARADD